MSASDVAARESENITALGAVAGGCSKERMSVTTCTRCGQPLRPGIFTCPTCGAAVAPNGNLGQANFPSPFAGGQPQSPASAFYGAPQNGGNGAFSAGSLISNDALPDWLLQAGGGSGGLQPNGAYGQGVAPAPGYGQPPQQRGYGQMPPSGDLGQPSPSYLAPSPAYAQPAASSAQALFDESALPDWLRQATTGYDVGQQPTAYQPVAPQPAYGGPAQYSAMPTGPAYAPGGYAGYPPPPPQRGGRSGGLAQSPYPGASQASAFPSLDMAGAHPANNAGGMSARGLIDSGALPGWLGGQPSQMPASSNSSFPGGNGMSAQSLIDETALPQWLRAQPAAPAQPVPQQRVNPVLPAGSWAAPATADEPLPTWLNQVYMDANVPRVEPARAPSDWLSPRQPSAPLISSSAPAEGRLSASAFVDESALPEWLKSQGGLPAQAALPPAPAGSYAGSSPAQVARDGFAAYTPGGQAEDAAPAKFSISDLIDPEALPSWVSGQTAGVGWTNKQPSIQAAASSTSLRAAPSASQTFQAPSGEDGGWDEPNLPSWMRSLGGEDKQPSSVYQSAPSARAPQDGLMRDDSIEPGASASRRRGQPIPSAELPPWLRAQRAGTGAGSPQIGGYAHQPPREPAGQQDWWPEESEPAQQWTDWDEDGFGSEYDAGMEYREHGDGRQDKQRGGWRRLFGRH